MSYQHSTRKPESGDQTSTSADQWFRWGNLVNVAVIMSLVALTAVGYASSGYTSYHLSSSQKISLAKSGRGTIRFSTLADHELNEVFAEFKDLYGKTVNNITYSCTCACTSYNDCVLVIIANVIEAVSVFNVVMSQRYKEQVGCYVCKYPRLVDAIRYFCLFDCCKSIQLIQFMIFIRTM